MTTVDEYNALDKQAKIDYLQKMLDTQVAYANELEIQNTRLEQENAGLKASSEASKGVVSMLEQENERLREVEKHAIELSQENMNGYCRHAPARIILELCGRCIECGNNKFNEDGSCAICKSAYDALSKESE